MSGPAQNNLIIKSQRGVPQKRPGGKVFTHTVIIEATNSHLGSPELPLWTQALFYICYPRSLKSQIIIYKKSFG